jgi:dGTPase
MREWFDQLLTDDKDLANKLGGLESQRCSDFRYFEGNAQTFRLISRLQVLADRHGLNLTAATLSAVSKYVAQSDEIDPLHKQRAKPGYFASENRLTELLRAETRTGDARNPIAYLVEAADDMTYTTVDLEDAVRKGAITWQELREELTAADPLLKDLLERCEDYFKTSTPTGSSLDEAKVQLFRTFAMYEHVSAAAEEFARSYTDIMAGTYKTELLEAGKSSTLLKACRRVAKQYVYCSPGVIRLEIMGRDVIHRLMTALWEAVSEAPPRDPQWLRTFPGKIYTLMSENYRRVFEEDVQADETRQAYGLGLDYRRLQLVADYVAGMTDSFAMSVAENLGLGK